MGGGGTERGLGGQFDVAFLAGRYLQRGGCEREGGVSELQPSWPVALALVGLCSPPSISPCSWPPPVAPMRFSCPVWVKAIPGCIGTRGGGAEGRLGLSRAWNLRRSQPRARRRLEWHKKNNSQRNVRYLPSETFLKLKGCG
ncbi:hypothetical protein I79_005664 [Cricetulus griseus]|uniref:Uncharacterized protein n=1 Tax=Cricetulus griseus TaxID=10029 RepID=G3H5S4_CRIGR|nr:hypothetical protein I79_005664 [Cricetulus griseus]